MPVPTIIFCAGMLILALFALRKQYSRHERTPRDPEARVLSHLQRLGSDFSRPHPIEFFLYFPTRQGAESAGNQLRMRGFSVQVEKLPDGSSWLCFAVKEMIPEYFELVNLRFELSELANSYDGEYDGWGTPIIPKRHNIVLHLWQRIRTRKYRLEEISDGED
jgi:hypothetical protein